MPSLVVVNLGGDVFCPYCTDYSKKNTKKKGRLMMKSVESVHGRRACMLSQMHASISAYIQEKFMLNVEDTGETSSCVPLRKRAQHSALHIYAMSTGPALKASLNMHLKARASLFRCEH